MNNLYNPIDTRVLKKDWTQAHHNLFNSIPSIVRDIAGDLFEIKWYGGNGYDGLMWEAKNNIFSTPEQVAEFKEAYDNLTVDQKNLIYYAYEA